MPCDGNVARYQADNDIVFGLDYRCAATEHFTPRVNQERAKNVDAPMKALDQFRSRQNHYYAHHQRAQHAPIKNAMLILGWNFEIREDQKEDEKIVNR